MLFNLFPFLYIYRFNRYMVECEFWCCDFYLIACCVLIDTWWNVNFLRQVRADNFYLVLIDTWWNVN